MEGSLPSLPPGMRGPFCASLARVPPESRCLAILLVFSYWSVFVSVFVFVSVNSLIESGTGIAREILVAGAVAWKERWMEEATQ